MFFSKTSVSVNLQMVETYLNFSPFALVVLLGNGYILKYQSQII